jgi:hypothetical protein
MVTKRRATADVPGADGASPLGEGALGVGRRGR